MSNSIITDDVLAGLRASAKSSGGGSWIRLTEKGEWLSGVVVQRSVEEAPFGEVETLLLKNVRTHDEDKDPDDSVEFRLSSTVLRRELGEEAEDGGAEPGMLIFVECTGQRASKAGRSYLGFNCVKMNAKDAAKAAKDAPKSKPKRDAAEVLKDEFDGVEEPPF